MTDKPDTLSVTDPHHVQPTFINRVVASGHFNGVINVTLGTFLFTPTVDETVSPDLVVSSRLRMDLACAQQLQETLAGIVAQMTKPNGTKDN